MVYIEISRTDRAVNIERPCCKDGGEKEEKKKPKAILCTIAKKWNQPNCPSTDE